MKQYMIIPKLERCGWHMEDWRICPVWYVGGQLPPSLTKRKTWKSVNSSKCKLNIRSEYANDFFVVDDGGTDNDDDIPKEKRPKVCFIS